MESRGVTMGRDYDKASAEISVFVCVILDWGN